MIISLNTDSDDGLHPQNSPHLDEMEATADPSSSCSEPFSSQSQSNCSSPQARSHSPSTSKPPHSPMLNPLADDTQLPNLPTSLDAIKQELEESPQLPKLRLNAILASDPALQPYAKDIKQPEPIRLDEELSMQMMDHSKNHSSTGSFVPINFAELILGESIRPTPIPSPAAERSGYTCSPCGIKFSSLSTLEAHQTYYCSHNRKEGTDVKVNVVKATSTATRVVDTTDEPPLKVSRIGKHYACNQCSYSADKKVSLNRHMRMHQISPAASLGASNGGDSLSSSQVLPSENQPPQSPTDCYCIECDIRFTSLKTYRAHKMHYCSERHRDG